MKIYKCMEPQPEIVFWSSAANGEWVASLAPLESISGNGFLRVACPHKIGDEIDYLYDWMSHKGKVKSCTPIQRDGRWKWEIEVDS